MHFGEWPTYDVDHINGDRGDNRAVNLRSATRSQNCLNRKVKNPSGANNVLCKKGYWVAQLTLHGEKHYLGQFKTPEEAVDARLKAEIDFGISQWRTAK